DVEMVRRLAREDGFVMDVVPAVTDDGQAISSSLIRTAVAHGDLASAERGLGRPYSLRAVVERGAGRGRTIGVPTINLTSPDPRKLLPPDGVYAVRVEIGKRDTGSGKRYGGTEDRGAGRQVGGDAQRVRDATTGRMKDTTIRRVPINLGLDLQGGIHLALEVDQSKGPVPDCATAIQLAEKVVRTRIDEFGTSEPVVQIQGRCRLIVELAGEKDPARAKGIIQRTAFLEFRITDMKNLFRDALPEID